MKKGYHLWVSGYVQGVGFRRRVQLLAEQLGIEGWVKNLEDGRVEIFLQTDQEEVDRFLQKLQKRTGAAEIEEIDIQEEKIDQRVEGFDITFS